MPLLIMKISFQALRISKMGRYKPMFNACDADCMRAALDFKLWRRAGGFPLICIKDDKN